MAWKLMRTATKIATAQATPTNLILLLPSNSFGDNLAIHSPLVVIFHKYRTTHIRKALEGREEYLLFNKKVENSASSTAPVDCAAS
jgi:hypothetical protein